MPTYCFTDNTTPSEGTGVAGSWINQALDSDDDTNHDDPLRLRQSTPRYRAALKAPNILSTLTAGMTVTAGSKLRIYKETATDIDFEIRRILRNWTAGGVRWSEYSAGNAWAAAGAADATDVSTTISATFTATSSAAGYLTFTGTQLDTDIQNMIDGVVNNYGWMADAAAASGSNAISQTWDTDGQRPELIVTVTTGGGSTSPPIRPQGTRIAPLMFY